MNNQLKELAKQSGIWFEDTKEIRTHSVSTTTLEKFAALIIKESCSAIKSHHSWHDPAVGEIKKYFGLEE